MIKEEAGEYKGKKKVGEVGRRNKGREDMKGEGEKEHG